MEDLLKCKGSYRINVGKDAAPLAVDKCEKWLNHNDEARGLTGMPISKDLEFCIQSLNTPQEAWVKHSICDLL
jgi:hypothetical protein